MVSIAIVQGDETDKQGLGRHRHRHRQQRDQYQRRIGDGWIGRIEWRGEDMSWKGSDGNEMLGVMEEHWRERVDAGERGT
jgi:hypothetical protein